ncbi:MAG: FG-GAP repeat domain-containing protein, partial [Blastocatellia bacterium]
FTVERLTHHARAAAPPPGGCPLIFAMAQNYGVGNDPRAAAVGDLNGDGKLDLAVANANISDNVSILLGDGAGGFVPATPPTVATGNDPFGIVAADFNRDGKLDLATANNNLSATVSVLLGNGDGTFAAAQSFAAPQSPWRLSAGDLNGDGKLDLAVAGP